MPDVSRKAVGTDREADRRRMQRLLQRIADGRKTKAALSLICDDLGFGWSRAKDLFYAERRAVVSPEELERVQRYVDHNEAVKNEYKELLARIERLERALLLADPDFGSDQVAALRSVAIGRNSSVGA